MCRVLVYGRGKGLPYLKRCIKQDVEVIAYIDNYSKDSEDGISVIGVEDIEEPFDYIVISIMKYERIVRGLLNRNIHKGKIISFFNEEDAEKDEFYRVIDPFMWKTELLWKYLGEVVKPMMWNLPYEAGDSRGNVPFIMTPDETIDKVIKERKSIVRFGDGEFEIMRNNSRYSFQQTNCKLSERLKEIIKSRNDDVLICIANNYGSLAEYTEEAANAIRWYMKPEIREYHMSFLDMNRMYGDAYLTRPYFMYRDKRNQIIKAKFDHLKEMWNQKDVMIVEGEHTRFGVGNDLLHNTNSIKRVLVPDKNAFDYYDLIVGEVSKCDKDYLIMCIIGPTATVLSYDLAVRGFWAIDIGQVDNEYEWFLRNEPERCDIPYKTVSEYVDKSSFAKMESELLTKYHNEIVTRICI